MVLAGFISHILAGLWFLVIRFGLWSPSYDFILPFAGSVFLLIGLAYLLESIFFLFEIVRGLKLSAVTSLLFLSISLLWGLSASFPWPLYVLLSLQIVSALLSITSIKGVIRKRKSGMSPLDLPVFG